MPKLSCDPVPGHLSLMGYLPPPLREHKYASASASASQRQTSIPIQMTWQTHQTNDMTDNNLDQTIFTHTTWSSKQTYRPHQTRPQNLRGGGEVKECECQNELKNEMGS